MPANLAFYVQGPTGKKINHHLGIDKSLHLEEVWLLLYDGDGEESG